MLLLPGRTSLPSHSFKCKGLIRNERSCACVSCWKGLQSLQVSTCLFPMTSTVDGSIEKSRPYDTYTHTCTLACWHTVVLHLQTPAWKNTFSSLDNHWDWLITSHDFTEKKYIKENPHTNQHHTLRPEEELPTARSTLLCRGRCRQRPLMRRRKARGRQY